MEGHQESPNTCNQGTGRLISNGWEEAGRRDAHPSDTLQSACMGRHRSDTYAQSHIAETAENASAAATKAAVNKSTKYACLTAMHHFVPIAIETGGLVADLGRRITQVTLEPLETQYLFQRISITLHRGNEIAFRNTFKTESFFTAMCIIRDVTAHH